MCGFSIRPVWWKQVERYHNDIFEAWHDEIFQQFTSNATSTDQEDFAVGDFVV